MAPSHLGAWEVRERTEKDSARVSPQAYSSSRVVNLNLSREGRSGIRDEEDVEFFLKDVLSSCAQSHED